MAAKKPPSIKKNFIMNAVLTMSSFIFPLITFPYVSRVLGPEHYGRVGFATSLVSYFAMFSQLGIPTYGIRACAKVRDDKLALTRTAHELLVINLVMSLISYTAFFLALLFVPRLREDRLLYIIVSVTILFKAIGMEWLYKGLERYTYITVRSILFKVIAFAALFALVHTEEDYVVYGGISVFAASASGIMNFINARKVISMHPVGGYSYRRHFRAVGIFFAMACATTVYTHLDTLMLGFLTTNTDVGYYNAAVRVKTILVSIVTSLGAVLLPRASYYIEHGEHEAFHRITKKAMNFIALAAIPLSWYFMLFAPEGIGFLSGSDYAGAILPMQIIMPTLFLIGMTNIMGIQILVPLGREKVVLGSEVAGAVTDCVLNFLLIPRYHAAGAAIGTLVAELVVLIWQYAALRNELRGAVRSIRFLEIGIATVLGTAGSVWLKFVLKAEGTWSCFLILALSAILYFGIYLLFLTLRGEPLLIEIEKSAIRKTPLKKRLENAEKKAH